MELLTLLLLGALLALFLGQRKANARLAALEREIVRLRQTDAREPEMATIEPAAPVVPEPAAIDAAPELKDEPVTPPVRETLAILFERFVAGRLLIWIGGIALAVAGVFLVRYSIEIGLVTPPVRMLIAAGFGLLLLAGGEAARERFDDQRVPQALIGAAILILYAAVYGSLTLYGLIGLGLAFALMAMITVAALALSLRLGPAVAVLGLSGGFLTPLLIGGPEAGAVPLLAYLGLLNVALFAIAQRRGWAWLAAGAILLSFGWTAALLFAAPKDALAAGIFVAALAIVASMLPQAGERRLPATAPAAIALLQLAVLVARTDLDAAAWLLFGILAAATLVLASLRPLFRPLPLVAVAAALLLLGVKSMSGPVGLLPAVAVAVTLLFGGYGALRAVKEKDSVLWTILACLGLAGPVLILRAGEAALLAEPGWALLMIGLALGAGLIGWQVRRWPAIAVTSAAASLLMMVALRDLLPQDWTAAGWLLVALAGVLAARKLGEDRLLTVPAAVAGAAALAILFAVPSLWIAIGASLIGDPPLLQELPGIGRAIAVLLVPAALILLLWKESAAAPRLRQVAMPAAIIFALAGLYVLAKQPLALRSGADFVARGFAERMLITQALFIAGFVFARQPKVAPIGLALTALAAARFAWFDLLVDNPALVAQQVGALPLLNLILPAYLGSAAWLWLARSRAGRRTAPIWLALFIAALIGGAMLLVRQAFHGAILSGPGVSRAEFYLYSLFGLLLALGILGVGIRRSDKPLRLAGFALLLAAILKVFLIDAAALEGLLRILSFLGLGVALIGIGTLYGRLLAPRRRAELAPAPE